MALIGQADRDSRPADAVVARAHLLRDAIYRACWSIAQGESPGAADLDVVMREYADATQHAQLVDAGTGIVWEWANEENLARPLWPVSRSAIDLLMDGDRSRIKVCPGPGRPSIPCAWLFYDTTRNSSRRWCSMADCGAATKIQLQTARRRAARPGSGF